MKSTQTDVFAETRRKGTLCVLLRDDSTPLPKWGMGRDIQNIRFFLIWIKFPSLLHRESLWVGKYMQPIPPAPSRTPCSPFPGYVQV